MSGPTATELILMLVHGEERSPRTLRGTLEFHDERGLRDTSPFHLTQPVEPVRDGTLEIAVDGTSFSVRQAGRNPWCVSDGTSVWTFERNVQISDVPLVGRRFLQRPDGYRDHRGPFRSSFVANSITPPLRWFLERLDAVEVADRRGPWQVAGRAREVEFLGRRAFTLPVRQSHEETELTFEPGTGLLLAVSTSTTSVRWSRLDTDPEFAAADEFSWSGPVCTAEEESARGRAEHEAQRQQGLANWRQFVGPAEFTVVDDVELDLTLGRVTSHDPQTGEFEASLAGYPLAWLSRQLRGVPGPVVPEDRGAGRVLRWSTPRYDWTITGLPADLTDRGRQVVADAFPSD